MGWLLAFPCGRFLAAQFNSSLEQFVTLSTVPFDAFRRRSKLSLKLTRQQTSKLQARPNEDASFLQKLNTWKLFTGTPALSRVCMM